MSNFQMILLRKYEIQNRKIQLHDFQLISHTLSFYHRIENWNHIAIHTVHVRLKERRNLTWKLSLPHSSKIEGKMSGLFHSVSSNLTISNLKKLTLPDYSTSVSSGLHNHDVRHDWVYIWFEGWGENCNAPWVTSRTHSKCITGYRIVYSIGIHS